MAPLLEFVREKPTSRHASTATWAFGVPRPYLMAIALSLAAALAPALWTGAWAERAQRWSLVFVELLALTIVAIVVTHVLRRRGPRRSKGRARAVGNF